jgi:arsenical pump membrane protein
VLAEPREVLGALAFVAAVVLVVVRPRGISEAWPAVGGAAAMVALGLVAPAAALAALSENLALLAFFLGLMVIAAVADEAGFFDETARWAVLRSRGSPRRLLVNVFLVGAAITALLTNDATALVLTPVVYVLVTRLKLVPTPFVFACTFVADAASFLLPVSNPVNLILLGTDEMRLDRYLWHLLPAALVVLAWNLGMFLWLFRAQLRGQIHAEAIPPEQGDPAYRRWVRGALGGIGLAYLGATTVGVHVGPVALAGAGAMVALAWWHGRLRPRRLAVAISWPLFPFVGAMVVLVEGVERLGATGGIGRGALALADASPAVGILAVTLGVALGANLINNVPMALVAAEALAGLPADAPARAALGYAAVLGADLGPNVSVAGSLATMLWLMMLRQRGLAVSSLHYLRLGLVVTPPALLLGAAALWTSASLAP